MHSIGIDIGTSSICGLVYNPETKVSKSVTKINHSAIQTPYDYEQMQDPDTIVGIVERILDGFTANYADIKNIGVTGQMHGILYVDAAGNAVSPLYTWQDMRGNLLYDGSLTYVQYLSAQTGHDLATGYGLVTHFYNMKNRLIPATAVKICTIMDYTVMKLTGRVTPLTDYSNAASFGFFDVEHLYFDTKALVKIGIDASVLPETGESATLAGYYRQAIAVYSAIGDNQAAFLGSTEQIIPAAMHITIGTGSQFSVYSPTYFKVKSLDTRPFPGGGYILVGASLCGGQSFAILKTFFESVLQLFKIPELSHSEMYNIMTSVVLGQLTEDLPVVETLFNGSRSEPSKRGSISNISSGNLKADKLIIAFLKGVAEELYHFHDVLPEEIKTAGNRLVGSGNGLKKNPLLVKLCEELFHCKLEFSKHEEEAAFGACLCGGL
ncbi:MAG: hypothetical protein LBG96_15910 [Tannerella sp.]|jgi:sedoheptulokinase|nr:hypothetical protein [Tannerella sp.]